MEARHSLGAAPPRLQEHSLQTAGCRNHEAVRKSARRGNCRKSVPEIRAHSGCRVARATTAVDFFSCFPADAALLWWDWSRVAHCSQRAEGTLPPSAVPTAELTQVLPLSPLPSARTRVGCPAVPRAGLQTPLWRRTGQPSGPPRQRRLYPLRSVFLAAHSPRTAASLFSSSPDAPELRAAGVPGGVLLSPSLPAAPRRCSAVTGAVPQVSRPLQRCRPHSDTRPAGFSAACNIVSFLTLDCLTLYEFESDAGYKMESYMLEINGKALILE